MAFPFLNLNTLAQKQSHLMTLEALLLLPFYERFLNTVSSRNFRHYYQPVTTSLDLRDLVAAELSGLHG